MKKSFLYSVMALFVCLFTACSQEEIVSQAGQSDNKVRLSVNIPSVGPAARAAADLNVDGYVMRCIMELVDADNNPIADSRQVVSVTGGVASFEFIQPVTTEYTCVFWSDYVSGADINNAKATIYDATSLTNIGYRLNKTADLFNNKAADAFCGKLTSSNITANINVTLKRPFARIAISKTELAKLGDLNQFTASINGAKGYNVLTGTTSDAITLNQAIDTATPLAVPADGEYALTCYVFPANDKVAKVSNIVFSNSSDPDSSKKTISITADQMKEMKPNVAVNLRPESSENDKVNVKIEIDNSFDQGGSTPDTPTTPVKIGDYLYADGTWGSKATDAVAIVFAVGKNENDKSTYSMLAQVNGYAVALKDAAAEVQYAENSWSDTSISDAEQDPKNNYSGYLNSHLTSEVNETAYNALAPIAAALKYDVNLEEDKTSGWYLPTVAQLQDIRALTDINTNFNAANYWSSVIATSGKPYYASFNPKDQTNYTGTNKATAATARYNVRPIVTF